MGKLTEKNKMFARYYISDANYNATKAYQMAYTDASYETANVHGTRLANKPEVKEYIRELQKEMFEAQHITAERVAMKLAELAFVERGDDLYGSGAQTKSLDLLQKQLGVQTTKMDIDADVNAQVVIIDDMEETKSEA